MTAIARRSATRIETNPPFRFAHPCTPWPATPLDEDAKTPRVASPLSTRPDWPGAVFTAIVGASQGSTASRRRGVTYAIRPSCVRARTTPTTRKRVSRPAASSTASVAPHPPPLGERRLLERKMPTVERNDLEILAEVERVRHPRLVPHGRVGDTRQSADCRKVPRTARDGELVGASDRLRVGLESRDE